MYGKRKLGDGERTIRYVYRKTNENKKVIEKNEKEKNDDGKILHIGGFVRPLQSDLLKEFLLLNGEIKFFWMNDIKSECIVEYFKAEDAGKAYGVVSDEKLSWRNQSNLLPKYIRKIPSDICDSNELDTLFRQTKAKPSLYYMVNSEEKAKEILSKIK